MAPVAKACKAGANVVRTSSRELDSYRTGTSPYATHSPDDSIARSDVDLTDNDSASDCGYLQLSTRHQDLPPMSLTIEVPTGHKGPLVVNLDINSLLAQARSQIHPFLTCPSPHSQSCADSGYSSTSSVTSEISKPTTTSKRSFLDLPAEIRNQIYQLAFVSEEKLDFAYPNNFSRSSSLLQTCRQVHEEGRTILYSENTFYFQRRKKERAVRWTTDVYEIGYKDIRFFLKSIGLANVSLLRRLIVMFEDATPSMNPHMKDAEQRRFTKDEDLIDILRLLGDHTMLKTLDLCFQGRRNFYNRDETRFIEHLTRIKADQVKCINNPDTPFSNWKGLSKIGSADAGRLTHEMTRRVTIFR
ncbi:hypothetical protein E4T47_09394 [Aureobasidium subglaciale]|nr:hypothetical protein E4T47_09394 [Aureobasidium subglaciale]